MTKCATVWVVSLLSLCLFVGACNPGVPLDSLDWTRTTPRNADLRGQYEAYVNGSNGKDLLLADAPIAMTLLRDGSLEIAGPKDAPELGEDVGGLADCLRAARGAWASVQDESGYWRIELRLRDPVRRTLSFRTSGANDPPYGIYEYFGDPDNGHVVGWRKTAGDEAAGPKSLSEAPEPVPLPVTEQMRRDVAQEDADTERFVDLIQWTLLTAVGALIAVVIALVVAWRRSGATAFRLLIALAGAAAGLPSGAVGGGVVDRMLHWPVRGWIAAVCGGIVCAAVAAMIGWMMASLLLRLFQIPGSADSPTRS